MLYENEWMRVTADDGIATLWLDAPGASPNRLGPTRMRALGEAIRTVSQSPAIEILVIRSAKPAGFCAGICLEEWATLSTVQDFAETARIGQDVLQSLLDSPLVTVAYVHGPVLGPGLELALACDHILAVSTPSTKIGFPELHHGFLTGWGGLTLLCEKLGPRRALPWLAGGEIVDARTAKQLGIIDQCISQRRAKIELRCQLDNFQRSERKPRRGRGWQIPDFRAWFCKAPQYDTIAPGHLEHLEAIARASAYSHIDGWASERRIVCSSGYRAGVGQALTLLRQQDRHLRTALAATGATRPLPHSIGIIGAVEPFASACAERGARCFIAGAAEHRLPGQSLNRIVLPSHHAETPHAWATTLEREQIAARSVHNPSTDPWRGFDQCEWILAHGGERICELEDQIPRHAVVMTVGQGPSTTQEFADDPGRIIGVMPPLTPSHSPLVEVLINQQVRPCTIEKTCHWLATLGWTPMVFQERKQGLLRTWMRSLWDECLRLVAEGATIEAVDRTTRELGLRFPALLGLDRIGLPAAATLLPRLRPLVHANLQGVPNGEGFYFFHKNNHLSVNVFAQILLWESECARRLRNNEHFLMSFDPVLAMNAEAQAQERLLLRSINATARLLATETHAQQADLDLAIAVGTGWLQAQGGPLHYADAVGIHQLIHRMNSLAETHGRRFRPHPEIIRRALAAVPFYEGASLTNQANLVAA